jgi:hypothetical protein
MVDGGASAYHCTMSTYQLWFYLQAAPNAPTMRKTNKGLQIEADGPEEAKTIAHRLMPDYAGQADFAKLYDADGNEIAQIDERRAQRS